MKYRLLLQRNGDNDNDNYYDSFHEMMLRLMTIDDGEAWFIIYDDYHHQKQSLREIRDEWWWLRLVMMSMFMTMEWKWIIDGDQNADAVLLRMLNGDGWWW